MLFFWVNQPPSTPESGNLFGHSAAVAEGHEEADIFLLNTLVIDLDAGTREILAEAVGNRGHQVTVSTNFEEAARLVSRGNFDCVVFKLREAWAAALDQLLKFIVGLANGATPHILAVVMDDPPARPLDWLQRGVDDCVMGLSRGASFDLRLAVAEKAMLARRGRAQSLAQSVSASKNFEVFFREAPEAVLVVTARDGLVLEASETAGRLLGLPLSEIRQRFLSLLMPGLLGRAELSANWHDPDSPSRMGDVPHRLPDGSLRTFEVCLGRCTWSNRPAIWVRIADVTVRRQAEAARRREARLDAVRSVSAGAAQALNDALTAIRGNIDLLSKQNTPRADARDLLESAASACERAEETVRTLGNLARPGHVGSRRRLVDLRHFLPRAISFAALRGSVIPEFDLAPALGHVEADEAPLKEVVVALVENADQAMAGGGPLRISARDLAAEPGLALRVAIEFRDAGEGIPPAHLPRLFDPYFTTRPGRQGLGLARALAIVCAHAGTIEVESAPGQGAIFRVILPAASAVADPAAPGAEGSTPRPPVAARGRVLVMDDDAGIRVIVEKILTMQGFDVYAVRDGQEAINAYRRGIEMHAPFDVVLLDLDVRGGMGGRECIARLRGEFPDVKAILATGYLDDSLLENHREHGFSGVITKPFNVERLVSTVGKLASA
ncbi:MAG: ATP-binding response regulator [Verrucomicrobiales bacterium]